jgi:benzoate membrane transport protein
MARSVASAERELMGSGIDERRGWLPAVGVASALTVIFVVVLSIPLGVASDLGLTRGQLTGWILATYGVPGVLSLVMVWRYRQPLLMTGNIFVLIFVASLGGELSWPELVGATMVAGVVVLLLGLLGLTDRLAAWLPAPIVFGVLAGAVLPFFVNLFDLLGARLSIVGPTLAAYLVGRRFLEPRIPAVLPALLVGLAAAGLSGGLAAPQTQGALPVPSFTLPVFSFSAIATAVPVIVVLVTLQANAPSVVFLRAQGYEPPERSLTVISGAGIVLASVFGPIGVSLSLPATALAAGPDAGAWSVRHRVAVLAGSTAIVIALLAGYASELGSLVDGALLAAVIGLAVIGVFGGALKEVVSGPLVLGPLIAFGIAISDLSLLGLGPFFWALVLGLLISRVVEHAAWTSLRPPTERAGAPR